ncbi:MAG: PKD domain-containing protein, partial [Planctomycetes bacterium]|nr:PKD domain-containing protein [Planctomycetota bacterium]
MLHGASSFHGRWTLLWAGVWCSSSLGLAQEGFRRGDVNGDALVDVADAVRLLAAFGFCGLPEADCPQPGAPRGCDGQDALEAADSNDDESITLGDPFFLLAYLFLGGPQPPPPFPGCGTDPTEHGRQVDPRYAIVASPPRIEGREVTIDLKYSSPLPLLAFSVLLEHSPQMEPASPVFQPAQVNAPLSNRHRRQGTSLLVTAGHIVPWLAAASGGLADLGSLRFRLLDPGAVPWIEWLPELALGPYRVAPSVVSDDSADHSPRLDGEQPCPEAGCLRIEKVEPQEVSTRGGTPIAILGRGFEDGPGLQAFLGGRAIQGLRVLDSRKATGIAPPGARGPADLAVTSGSQQASLSGSVTYQDPVLPGVTVTEGFWVENGAVLRWKLPRAGQLPAGRKAYDGIELVCRETGTTIQLPGDAVEYLDRGVGPESFPRLTYGVSGWLREALPDGAAGQVRSVPEDILVKEIDCQGGLSVPGATGTIGREALSLHGSGDQIVQGEQIVQSLHVPEGASRVQLTVHAAHLRDPAVRLKAKLLPLSSSGTGWAKPLGETELPEVPLGSKAEKVSWTWDLPVAPRDLPGDFAVALECAGGSGSRVCYSFSSDASQHDLGEPFPQPPYPWLAVQAADNQPPIAEDVTLELKHPAGTVSDELTYLLRARARDPDGHVVRYRWHFGDGKDHESRSSGVTHTFPRFGAHQVQVTVTDDRCGQGTWQDTVYVKPPVPHPDPGAPPAITHLEPDPRKQSFVPDLKAPGDPKVLNTYSVLVTPARGASIAGVTFAMRAAGKLGAPVPGARAHPLDPDPQGFWRATFNMSELPEASSAELEVTAQDDQGRSSVARYLVPLCPRPKFFDYGFVERKVTYAGGEYRFEGALPKESTVRLPALDLGPLGKFENSLDARLSASMRLKGRQWYAGELSGLYSARLFGFDVLKGKYEVKAPEGVSLLCPDVGLRYEKKGIVFYDD